MKTAAEHVDLAMRQHPGNENFASMRCALGDAAALCDSLCERIKAEHRGRGGKIKKRGLELAAIAKQAGDEIWAMRELIVSPRAATGGVE